MRGQAKMQLTKYNCLMRRLALTGITITKLDGTAKGGVLFNIASRTHVPIRYIGVGKD